MPHCDRKASPREEQPILPLADPLYRPPPVQEPQRVNSSTSYRHAQPIERLRSPGSARHPTRTRDVPSPYSSIASVSEALLASTPLAPQPFLFNAIQDVGDQTNETYQSPIGVLHEVQPSHDLQLERYDHGGDQIIDGPDQRDDSDDDESNYNLRDSSLKDGDDFTITEHDTWVVDNTISNLLFQTSLAPGEEIAFMYCQ